MRHYEIVFLVHPDQSDQTQSILNKFSSVVTDSGGVVHRSENIGNRRLSYPIQDQFKAFFGLMNIECSQEVIKEIKDSFKFNDSIIRDLVMVMKKAQTDTSALSSQANEEEKIVINSDSESSFQKTDGLKKQKESKKEAAPEELEQKESKKEAAPEELEQKESKKEAALVVEENPVKNLKDEETKDLEKPILND